MDQFTPFSEDRREPDFQEIKMFDFGFHAPNQDGDTVEMRVKLSEGVVRNLKAAMESWLERNFGG